MDEELRRELLARRDEDQRVRALVSPPPGQYTAGLADGVAVQWQRIDQDNTRWLGGTAQRPGLAGADAGR